MKALLRTEDWWAVWIGLLIFVLALGVAGGADLLGWGASTGVWLNVEKAVAPSSAAYQGLAGWQSLILTFLFLLGILTAGAAALKLNLPRFVAGFSVLFWASYACLLLGHYAYIAATPNML